MAEKEKPTLVLLQLKEATVENLAKMFEKLTGRKPTAEEIEQAQKIALTARPR